MAKQILVQGAWAGLVLLTLQDKCGSSASTVCSHQSTEGFPVYTYSEQRLQRGKNNVFPLLQYDVQEPV